MDFVEIKCPHCGAEIKAGIYDKQAFCESCKKSFEINGEAKKPKKAPLKILLLSLLAVIIIIICAIAVFTHSDNKQGADETPTLSGSVLESGETTVVDDDF